MHVNKSTHLAKRGEKKKNAWYTKKRNAQKGSSFLPNGVCSGSGLLELEPYRGCIAG